MQRVADGHIAIIRHDCQEKTVNSTECDKKEHLGPTASQWNVPPAPPNVGKHQGHHDGGVVDFYKGQARQEEIHWGVQGAVCAHHPDDGRVATKDHQIEEEKEEKEESLEMGGGGEPAEHELSGAGLVEGGAPSKHVSCRRRIESPESSWAELTYCLPE